MQICCSGQRINLSVWFFVKCLIGSLFSLFSFNWRPLLWLGILIANDRTNERTNEHVSRSFRTVALVEIFEGFATIKFARPIVWHVLHKNNRHSCFSISLLFVRLNAVLRCSFTYPPKFWSQNYIRVMSTF